MMKIIIAGAIGAGLLYVLNMALNPVPTCSSCPSQAMQTLGTGFAVGAGVQAGVMLLGVS